MSKNEKDSNNMARKDDPIGVPEMPEPNAPTLPGAPTPSAPPPASDSIPAGKKSEKVVVLFDGNGSWQLDYPGRGVVMVEKGKTASFDVHHRQELHCLLQIYKEINSQRRNKLMHLETQGNVKVPVFHYKFQIVSGEQFVPAVLRKITFRETTILQDEEIEAIKALCPDYFIAPASRRQNIGPTGL